MIFTIVGVFGTWLIGLALALLLRTRIPAGRFLQGVVDAALGGADRSVVHRLELAGGHPGQPDAHPGPRALGFGELLFLADPTLAAITVCIFKVWVSFPFMMLMTSAALASVDTTVYEASSIDGANKWQQLTQITLPIISRSTYISGS